MLYAALWLIVAAKPRLVAFLTVMHLFVCLASNGADILCCVKDTSGDLARVRGSAPFRAVPGSDMSYARTATWLAGLTAIFIGGAFALAGEIGFAIAVPLVVLANVAAYSRTGGIIFGRFIAREVNETSAPILIEELGKLANRANLPTPRAFIFDSDQPNAFATGQSPSVACVAVTKGLMRHLSLEQIRGVLAHELGHIRNRDNLVLTVTATLAGVMTMTAGIVASTANVFARSNDVIAFTTVVAIAALLAMIAQMAVSRGREFEADAAGAAICGHPEWIASALEEVARRQRPFGYGDRPELRAPMLLFGLGSRAKRDLGMLFSTHPSSSDRIERLRLMSNAAPWS